MICKLCGFEFSKSAVVCKGCFLFGKCKTIICCPHCGYQTVEEASVSRLIKKYFMKGEKNGQ